MKIMLDIIYLFLLVSGLFSCEKETEVTEPQPVSAFVADPIVKEVTPMILETSGIADSRNFPGHVWVQEDSGNPSQLILLKHDGSVQKKIMIDKAMNRDWEDMALMDGQLYLADIGDNRQIFENYWFYIFPEPAAETDIVREYKTIMFRYPDGSHDAEAFMVDPATKDIFIITKRDNPSRLYKITYPYSDASMNTASFVGTLPYTGVVSAALAPDGKEFIVKTYSALFHYKRDAKQSLAEALQKNSYTSLAYQLEPQGEAVSFAISNNGFFTLSEKGFGAQVNLYFYQRK